MTRHPTDTPQFYLTAPSPCPYLPDQQERKVFTHLVGSRAKPLNDVLTQGGFRRSQNIAYRPACENCQACISIRIRVDDFDWTRSFRRVWKRNADVVGTELDPTPSSEQYSLFRRYLDARHAHGGMSDMSVLDYAMMIEDTHVETKLIEYRRRGPDTFLTGRGDGPLLAVALTDVLGDGLSMVYSFFDPEVTERSLGSHLILDHIERARALGLPYVYLGYWVNGSPKMDYKARFQPQDHLGPDGWAPADD
ncbi:arginyltransferase [Stappia sp.]|uniref:arginyltransferase n=1 Tax=Stappia sp. TaxID=1870903 RepID=UPI003A9A3870